MNGPEWRAAAAAERDTALVFRADEPGEAARLIIKDDLPGFPEGLTVNLEEGPPENRHARTAMFLSPEDEERLRVWLNERHDRREQ